MVQLELLNQDNEIKMKNIKRDDIPVCFAEDVSYTIKLSKWDLEIQIS